MNNEAKRLKEILGILTSSHIIKDQSPINVRKTIEKLGPTFVKLGQILSARSDMIPKKYCDELKKLLSSADPIPYEEILSILNDQYNNKTFEIFKTINKTPLGSASIAQTHKAVLKTGENVVIKVQRKNIDFIMTQDVKLMKNAIKILHLDLIFNNVVDLNKLLDEMYSVAKEEMDFNIEASHIKEFNEYNKDINYIKTLKVYDDISTQYVLVMSYIGGNNINEVDELTNKGYDMKEIAQKLAQNYIKQAIDDGFYHADPHSDNIKIEDGKIVFIDFGMIGRISAQHKELLNRCIKAIVESDTHEVAHVMLLLNTKDNDVDNMKLMHDIDVVLDKNKTTEIAKIDIKSFVNDMYTLLISNGISLPKDVTMLIRGVVVIGGLLEEICPEISMIEVLKNRVTLSNYLTKEQINNLLIKGINSSTSLVKIPAELLTSLKGINSGELRFNVELNNSKTQNMFLKELFNEGIITIIDVALILSISIMTINNTKSIMMYVYIVLSILLTIWLIIKIIKKKKV